MDQQMLNGQHSSPNYSFVFQFEEDFEPARAQEWMARYWHTSFYAVAIYLLVIFGGQAYMSQRPAYKLKGPLTLWNTCLALFSIMGSIRTMPELVHVLSHFGFQRSICSSSFMESVKPSAFWSWLFALSKVPELGDTVFIVLRKQNLIFLHWYHHITVLLYTWFTYSEFTAPARWFVDMNLLVHSLMYTYYTLRSLGFRMPKPVSMAITTSQIVQMVMGAYVTGHAYYLRVQGEACNISQVTATFALAMYLSYFALFAHFFYTSYFSGAASKPPRTRQQANGAGKGLKVE